MTLSQPKPGESYNLKPLRKVFDTKYEIMGGDSRLLHNIIVLVQFVFSLKDYNIIYGNLYINFTEF